MNRSVTIALIGDARHQKPSDPIPQRELDRPYEDRAKVTLDVSEEDHLGSLMAEAA